MVDYTYVNPQHFYAGSPVQEIKALNESQSKEYDTNYQASNALDVMYNNLDVEDRAQEIKKRKVDEFKSKFAKLVESGNYQDAKYLVQQTQKDFLTDKELQGALTSKKKYNEYVEDLRNRLESGSGRVTSTDVDRSGNKVAGKTETDKRTGGINRDIYNYALAKTKAMNTQPLKYNPETGVMENSFAGHNVIDDRSGEIYNELDKRTQGWKADTITADGKTYTMDKSNPRGYIVVETGEKVDRDEVKGALVKELATRGDWQDFLSQERDINRYKQFGSNDITPEAFKSLGFKDERGNFDEAKLKDLMLGIDSDEVSKLEKSKSVEDQKKLLKIEEDRATLDLNNVDKSQLLNVYDNIQKHQQLSDYATPAADKASYVQTKPQFLKDEAYLMALDFGYKKKLKELEKKLEVPFYPTDNFSVAKTLSQADLDKMSLNYEKTTRRVGELETAYGKDVNKMPEDIKNEYSGLKANLKIYQDQTSKIYDDINKKGGNIYGKVKENLFSGENPTELWTFLNTNEATKGLEATRHLNWLYQNWQKNPTKIGAKGESFDISFDDYVKENMGDKFMSQLEGVKKSNLYNSPFLEKAVEDYTHNVGVNTPSNSTNIFTGGTARLIDKTRNKYFEDNENDIYQINTKVIADDGDKKSPIHQMTNKYKDLAIAGTDIKSSDDKSLLSIIADYNEKQGKDGKKIDANDVKVNVTTQPVMGRFALNIALPNGETELLYPADQESYKRDLSVLGDYVKTNPNKTEAYHGHEINANLNFGHLRQEIGTLASREVGGLVPIDLPINTKGQVDSKSSLNQKYTLKVINKNSDGSPIYSLADAKGSTVSFDNAIGSDNNKFSNLAELINSLQAINASK